MNTSVAKRIRLNESADLATRTSLIWMRFGTYVAMKDLKSKWYFDAIGNSKWPPAKVNLCTVVPKVLFKLCYFVSDLSKNMAVMRFWLVHFRDSSSWEPLNGFEWNLVWMFLWRSLTSIDSFWAIYEFQNDLLCRSKFYWNSMGNNIFIIFSRNTQQSTTKLGTFVNFMCVYKCPVLSQ
jgi:hypothetical protein